MPQFEITKGAKSDLDGIIEYTIKHWGQKRSAKYLDEIHSKILMLCKSPNIGALREDIHPELFSFPIKKHILYYLKQKDKIVVIRVLHAHMLPKLRIINSSTCPPKIP